MVGESLESDELQLIREMLRILDKEEFPILKEMQSNSCLGCSTPLGQQKPVFKSPGAYRISQIVQTLKKRKVI